MNGSRNYTMSILYRFVNAALAPKVVYRSEGGYSLDYLPSFHRMKANESCKEHVNKREQLHLLGEGNSNLLLDIFKSLNDLLRHKCTAQLIRDLAEN